MKKIKATLYTILIFVLCMAVALVVLIYPVILIGMLVFAVLGLVYIVYMLILERLE